MVRQCVVPGCKSNDKVALCHRFPKRKEFMEKWRRSLGLAADPAELFSRYVVCTLHFKASDYRNLGSRMLNLMAVPTLNVLPNGEFSLPEEAGKETKQSEPVPEATEIEVLEIQQVEAESRLIGETIEPVDEEFEVYYIEEEVKSNEEQLVSEILSMEVLEEYPLVTTHPPKRKCPQEEPQSEPSPPKITPQDVAVQTDDDVEHLEEQLQRRLVAEQYPEYARYDRLQFAKELREASEQLAEVKKKLAHIEAAHAVVREAFKSIMS